MEQQFFDDIVRALSTSTSRRQVFKSVGRLAAGAVGAWLSWETVVPVQSVYAASCPAVNDDGFCPPNSDKVPKPENTPTSNGCGPEGGALRVVLPQSYGKAPFYPSCNGHDICYESCTIPKGDCDYDFFEGMVNSCTKNYDSALEIIDRGWCSNLALTYYGAVSLGGDDAWVAAQKKACQCYPSQLYCSCNNKCYPADQISTCLDECEVSLGCFSGICGPATMDTCPC